jgi:6-phosphogluconolactonase
MLTLGGMVIASGKHRSCQHVARPPQRYQQPDCARRAVRDNNDRPRGRSELESSVSVTVLDDRTALMRTAADRVVGLAARAITARGRCNWALAGGSTPEALYQLLAGRDHVGRVDWSKVHFFWGDERCVPPDHPDSNYRMATMAFLDTIAAPRQNVHRMEGELDPELAADRYQAELERHFELRVGQGFPEFDLILLGMGADGHTASLFPGTPGLEEARRWVVANRIEALGTTRLSLTLPVINAAAHVLFLVAGADKAERLAQVLSPAVSSPSVSSPSVSSPSVSSPSVSSPAMSPPLPAQRVLPRGGSPEWLADAAAGARLGGSS